MSPAQPDRQPDATPRPRPDGGLAGELRALGRRRLRSLVEGRLDTFDQLHAAGFQLVTPGGTVWTKQQYLQGLRHGTIDYRRFEAVSGIEVSTGGDVAVLRYRSAIEISVAGQRLGPLACWHLDSYERDPGDGRWRVRWCHATEISGRGVG